MEAEFYNYSWQKTENSASDRITLDFVVMYSQP
jgi:hypothetical protein